MNNVSVSLYKYGLDKLINLRHSFTGSRPARYDSRRRRNNAERFHNEAVEIPDR